MPASQEPQSATGWTPGRNWCDSDSEDSDIGDVLTWFDQLNSGAFAKEDSSGKAALNAESSAESGSSTCKPCTANDDIADGFSVTTLLTAFSAKVQAGFASEDSSGKAALNAESSAESGSSTASDDIADSFSLTTLLTAFSAKVQADFASDSIQAQPETEALTSFMDDNSNSQAPPEVEAAIAAKRVPAHRNGSVGHPHRCAEACKFLQSARGCKDGDQCAFCHRCKWTKRGKIPMDNIAYQ